MNLNEEPRILGLALGLNLDVIDPVEAIRDFCRGKVSGFLKGLDRVSNIRELQQIVAVHLNVVIHEVWSDADVIALTNRYVSAGEVIFSNLASQLDAQTYGILIRLKKLGQSPRFAAIIDCRGTKELKRYWTTWHELAHALTYVEQGQFAFKRAIVDGPPKDPIEQLTDKVASDFAFFPPLFRPVLRDELNGHRSISFDIAERVRNRFCTDASFASTLNACVAAAPMATILLECGPAHKKAERERLDAGETGIAPTLRVLKSNRNKAAEELKLHIPVRRRVPPTSIISQVLSRGGLAFGTATENLSQWECSDGTSLPNHDVVIEARRSGTKVTALVTVV